MSYRKGSGANSSKKGSGTDGSQKFKKVNLGSRVSSAAESLIDLPKIFLHPNERDPDPEFDLKAFLGSLPFEKLFKMDDKELEKHLSNVDAIDLLNAVQGVTRDLTKIKLENNFLTDFLHKNDPKLLIGLQSRRLTAASSRRHSVASSYEQHATGGVASTRLSSRPSVVTAQSLYTTASMVPSLSKKQGTSEYRLNYRAKAEMAEKTAIELEKRIEDMETKAMQKIKALNVNIEEMRYTIKELQETAKNFELHFLKNQRDVTFLETAPERDIERNLRKFVHDWLKNARLLLGTMRLRITKLREICQHHRNDLMIKADVNPLLSRAGFDELVIERDDLLAALEEKHNHLKGLKDVTGKASMTMSQGKKSLARLENESQLIVDQVKDIMRTIDYLEKEVKYIEHENNKDLRVLSRLQDQVDQFEAPGVSDYIERKEELLALEKEEKTLQRKIDISTMKLRNALKRCNRHDDVATTSLVDSLE